MKVSIVSTVYNKEKFLIKHINSLLCQKYDNIQIIFVDDGSTDDSLKILKKYKKISNNIEVITQDNQGPSYARRNGFQHADGELIYFVDSDDFLHDDNVINRIVAIFKQYPEIDFLVGKMDTLYKNRIETDKIIYDDNIHSGKYSINLLYNKATRGSLCCKVFKKINIDKSFFINSKNYEDAFFSFKYYSKSKIFYYYNTSIYTVNKTDNVSLTTNININLLDSKYNVLNQLSSNLEFSNFKEALTRIFLKAYLDDIYYSLRLSKKNKKEFLVYLYKSEYIQVMLHSAKYKYLIHNTKYHILYLLHRFLLNFYINFIIGMILRRRKHG